MNRDGASQALQRVLNCQWHETPAQAPIQGGNAPIGGDVMHFSTAVRCVGIVSLEGVSPESVLLHGDLWVAR